ncbi:ARP6_2 [Sanghuangporus vaninii]
MQPTPVLVLDNGASTIKTGIVAPGGHEEPLAADARIVTNAIVRQTKGEKKTYFGHEFDRCRDFSSLHFRLPFERGYLTDWDAQKAIWDGLFYAKDGLKVNTSETSLIITEPYFNLPNIQDQYDQFVFEEYDFQSCYRCTPASLLQYGTLFSSEGYQGAPECMLIVDSGFSFTHVVPLMSGKVLWKSVRRRVWSTPWVGLDVGGKFLTNYLKELLSFRQYDLMGETYITNDVKERCCYVSTNYKEDMEFSRFEPSKIVQEYILPRYSENRPGRVKTQEDVLTGEDDVLRMNTERFAVGELLFRPSDIGLPQAGLSYTISDAISSLPEDVQGLFWANIGLIGGNARLPGFRNRLMTELRSLAPAEHEVRIYESSNPIIAAYLAGAEFARQPGLANVCVTRAEYQEAGSRACRRKFKYATWQAREEDEETTQGSRKDMGTNAGMSSSRTRPKGSKTQEGVLDSAAGAERKPLRSSRSRTATKS